MYVRLGTYDQCGSVWENVTSDRSIFIKSTQIYIIYWVDLSFMTKQRTRDGEILNYKKI